MEGEPRHGTTQMAAVMVAALTALFVGNQIGDHVVQRDATAQAKAHRRPQSALTAPEAVVAMAGHPKTLTPEVSPRHRFGAELRRWRELRCLSQRRLAELVLHSEETVAKVERAERWPSRSLATGCDDALHTGGVLQRLWPAVEEQRVASDRRYRRNRGPATGHAKQSGR